MNTAPTLAFYVSSETDPFDLPTSEDLSGRCTTTTTTTCTCAIPRME